MKLQLLQLEGDSLGHFSPTGQFPQHVLADVGFNPDGHAEIAAYYVQLLSVVVELDVAEEELLFVDQFLLAVPEIEELSVQDSQQKRPILATFPALEYGLGQSIGVVLPSVRGEGAAFLVVGS